MQHSCLIVSWMETTQQEFNNVPSTIKTQLNNFCASGKAFYDKGNGLIAARLGQRMVTRKSEVSSTSKQYQTQATGKKVKHQIRLIARRIELHKQNGTICHSLSVIG